MIDYEEIIRIITSLVAMLLGDENLTSEERQKYVDCINEAMK